MKHVESPIQLVHWTVHSVSSSPNALQIIDQILLLKRSCRRLNIAIKPCPVVRRATEWSTHHRVFSTIHSTCSGKHSTCSLAIDQALWTTRPGLWFGEHKVRRRIMCPNYDVWFVGVTIEDVYCSTRIFCWPWTNFWSLWHVLHNVTYDIEHGTRFLDKEPPIQEMLSECAVRMF